MKSLRNLLFWCHLTIGVSAAIFIFIMAATGALIAFQRQILEFSDAKLRNLPAQATGKTLSPAALLQRFEQFHGSTSNATSLTLRSDPSQAANLAIGRDSIVYLDPRTGSVRGEGSTRLRSFFRISTELHRWLMLSAKNRSTGKAIMGAANSLFLLLALSGIYLWIPRTRNRRSYASVLIYKKGLAGRA
jgi:uncharacterized iron-regulated membrane protein